MPGHVIILRQGPNVQRLHCNRQSAGALRLVLRTEQLLDLCQSAMHCVSHTERPCERRFPSL